MPARAEIVSAEAPAMRGKSVGWPVLIPFLRELLLGHGVPPPVKELPRGRSWGDLPLAEILRQTEGSSVRDGYAVLRSGALPAYRAMLDSEDAQEGARAFAERRKPRWRGR